MRTTEFTEFLNRALYDTNAIHCSIHGENLIEVITAANRQSAESCDGLATETIYRHCKSGAHFRITVIRTDGEEKRQ